ncbi:MAG: hypothetical protein Kow0096_19620 [Thiohalomonadaceae bacterium]
MPPPWFVYLLRCADGTLYTGVKWHAALNKTVLRRRYLAWWQIEGQDQPGLSVFEWSTRWWAGVTAFTPGGPGVDLGQYLANQRVGIRRWKEE